MNPYGTFQERTSFNTTKFPAIQLSMIVRMGLMYPIMSAIVEKMGLPKDSAMDYHGFGINFHTWTAGYFAYLSEIQLGLSKYPMEFIGKGIKKIRGIFSKKSS